MKPSGSSTIHVSNLTKHFRVYEKEPGIKGAIKSLVSRKYYNKTAVDNVSFEIEEGELVGFIGPNGAGKTTTLKCLTGLLHPSSGDVSVMGYTPFERNHEYLRQISLIMGQKNQLEWDLPAYESFLLNKEIYQIPDKKFKDTLSDLSELLEVKDVLQIQVRKLSLGQRMKCEIIGQLLHSPKTIFLDEPTIGLDVVMQHSLRNFIRQYNKEFSSTIMLTSHYMEDVRNLCKRIIVINHGNILYDGSFSSLIKKHTQDKHLTLYFAEPVTKSELSKYGNVKEFKSKYALLEVKKGESNRIAATILNKYNIEDLNIEEPDLDDVIRSFFKGNEIPQDSTD